MASTTAGDHYYGEVVTIMDALVVDAAVAGDLLGLVDDLRAAGRRVALAATGPSDVAGRFDAVVDATAKPAPGFFASACTAVAATPDRTLFVDEADRNVRGARAAGLKALRYGGPDDLRYVRAALGV